MSSATVSRTRSTDKRFYGVVEGIVTSVDDSDGKEGRVKVQFPWFDHQMETEWCRVRQFYAGNGYGAFFVPEVNDEVLIAFIHGSMRRPIILGGLYNGKDKPPTYRSAAVDGSSRTATTDRKDTHRDPVTSSTPARLTTGPSGRLPGREADSSAPGCSARGTSAVDGPGSPS